MHATEALPGRDRRRVIAGILAAVFALVAAAVGGALLFRSTGDSVPDRARQAAVAYVQRSAGRTGGEILAARGWPGCAVVTVDLEDRRMSVAVFRMGDTWVVGRGSDQGIQFDTDDVATEAECMAIARSPDSVIGSTPG